MRSATHHARVLGACVGIVLGAAFALVVVIAAHDGQPLRPETAAAWLAVSLPFVVAGGSGGWRFAPSAEVARTRNEWVNIVAKLGGWAVLVGAFASGLLLGLGSAVGNAPGVVEFVGITLGVGLFLAACGIVLFGIFVLPFTLAGAVIWAVLMRRLWTAR